jgi:hypothetical protein
MSKQIIIRVDDDLKVLGDAVLRVQGVTQQEVIEALYKKYIFDTIDCTWEEEALMAAYDYVIKRQQADIAPLLAKMEEYQLTKAHEEAREAELMELYSTVRATKNGKKLLDVLSRRLQSDNPRYAISDVYQDNFTLVHQLFNMNENDDGNEIISMCMILARIHTTQT